MLIAVSASKAQNTEEAYPFGIQLRVLAQDVVSRDYQVSHVEVLNNIAPKRAVTESPASETKSEPAFSRIIC